MKDLLINLDAVSYGIIVLIPLVVVAIEMFVYRKQPTQQEIDHYQKFLDEYHPNEKIDPVREIVEQRDSNKGIFITLAGVLLMCLTIVLIVVHWMKVQDMVVVAIPLLLSIFYGFIKLSTRKKQALLLLFLIMVASSGVIVLYDDLCRKFSYTYYLLFAMVMVACVLFLFVQCKKKISLVK